jgi:SAM-dependent methyltransferase
MIMAQETANPDYMAGTYFDYQKRYSDSMRESDKIMLDLVLSDLHTKGTRRDRLLDIGCSNGNFLAHLRAHAPAVEYWGGDLQPAVIDRCRTESHLKGIQFEVMDIRDLSPWPQFDVIIANAVLFRFPENDFASICGNLARALTPGGKLFTFDFYHRFEQQIAIVETSTWHPHGLMLHIRSYDTAQMIFRTAGFERVTFQPFDIPIDLAARDDPADIGTYTRMTREGDRLMFRGSIYQPWCHAVAHKAS